MASAPSAPLGRPFGMTPASLVLFGMGIAIAYWAAGQIAGDNYRNILFAALAAQVVWVLARWRMSVYIFMTYVVVEGFLLNYFSTLPELNLLKDIFVVALFVGLGATLVARGIVPIPWTSWMIPFAGFSLVYIAQVFNPALPNILVGLVGIRVTLMYALLVPVAFWFFDARERVFSFFLFMVLSSIPVAAFGIVQYFAGPSWLIAISPGFERAIFYAYGFSNRPGLSYFRTISTFVQTGGFSVYLHCLMTLTLAVWCVPALRKHRIWVAVAFVLQFIAALTTGGRGPLAMLILSVGFLLILHRGSIRMGPLLVLIPLLFWGSIFAVGEQFVDRFATMLDFDYATHRNMGLMEGWFNEAMKSDWIGLGAGYACIASRHAGATPLNGSALENAFARIRFESGVPGLALYFLFILTVAIEILRTPFQVRDPGLRWLCGGASAYVMVSLLVLPMGTPFEVSPSNVYLWFFMGFIAKARALDSRQLQEEIRIRAVRPLTRAEASV